jgi:hypothetical protein
VLQHLELGAAVKSFTLKVYKKWFTVSDLEEDVQVVLHNLLGVVEHTAVHLLSRSQRATFRFNYEDLLGEDVFLKGLVTGRLSWVSPGLHFDFRIVWHLETPVCLNATHIFNGEDNFAGFGSISNWHLSEVPLEFTEALHELFIAGISLI